MTSQIALCARLRELHNASMEPLRRILLVEDNEAEERLARKAIRRSGVNCVVRVAKDGQEACSILFDSEEPTPDLILLDLYLPKMNGFEVLEMIRGRSITRRIPVVMLSSSPDAGDVTRSFDLSANSFVSKGNLDTYDSRMKVLLYYWMAVNEPCA